MGKHRPSFAVGLGTVANHWELLRGAEPACE